MDAINVARRDNGVAVVSLDHPSKPIPEMLVVTDQAGRYEWSLPPGSYLISVSVEGYRPASTRASISANRVTTLSDIELEREAEP